MSEIKLICDEDDYAAIDTAIRRWMTTGCLPQGHSNTAATIIAIICRGWMDNLKAAEVAGGGGCE